MAKDPDNPLPGQEPEEPPAEIVEGEQEWELQEILASRMYRRQLQYQVKWTGYDTDPTWYLADNFEGSPYLLRDFYIKYLEKPLIKIIEGE